MKTARPIVAYTHPPVSPSTQVADPRPGNYYVSAVDFYQTWLLLGPFRQHQKALDCVELVRSFAIKHEPRAAFYGFGTLCLKEDADAEPGSANKYMPELLG